MTIVADRASLKQPYAHSTDCRDRTRAALTLRATFCRGRTPRPDDEIVTPSERFVRDEPVRANWKAFVTRNHPDGFDSLGDGVSEAHGVLLRARSRSDAAGIQGDVESPQPMRVSGRSRHTTPSLRSLPIRSECAGRVKAASIAALRSTSAVGEAHSGYHH